MKDDSKRYYYKCKNDKPLQTNITTLKRLDKKSINQLKSIKMNNKKNFKSYQKTQNFQHINLIIKMILS